MENIALAAYSGQLDNVHCMCKDQNGFWVPACVMIALYYGGLGGQKEMISSLFYMGVPTTLYTNVALGARDGQHIAWAEELDVWGVSLLSDLQILACIASTKKKV